MKRPSMKRPIIPIPRRKRSFNEKFGRETTFFGSREKYEPQPKTYLPYILLGMVGVLILSVALCFLGTLPRVGEVSAEGGRMYDSAHLLYYADIHSGDALLGFDSRAVEKQMKRYMPLLKSAKVRKHINGDVSISTSEYDVLYYTCHNRNYYAFTADTWEVLCAFSQDTEPRRVEAIYIGLPEAARVRVDEKISYINLPYASDHPSDYDADYEIETDVPEKEYAYVKEFVDTLMSSPLAPRVKGMELSDRYDLWFILDGSVRVSVGDMANLSDKLSSVQKALEDRAASGVDAGDMPLEVTVSDPTRTVVRSSPNVQIPVWGRNN